MKWQYLYSEARSKSCILENYKGGDPGLMLVLGHSPDSLWFKELNWPSVNIIAQSTAITAINVMMISIDPRHFTISFDCL